MKVQHVPFAQIALSVLLGISLSIYFNPVVIISLTGFFAMTFHFIKELKSYVAYCILILLSFVLGHISFHQNPFQNIQQQTYEWKGIVIEKGQEFSKGMRYVIEVLSVSNREKEHPTQGKVLLLTQNDKEIEMGQIVRFEGKCQTIFFEDSSFWNQVNFKKGIHASVWSRQVEVTHEVHSFYYCLGRVQSYFTNKMNQFIKEPQSAALATGILLGDKSLMNKETKNEFIESGAAHILAVSGLHVTILIVFLSYFLGIFIPGRLKYFIIILFLIFYGLITGLSPAVVRAVLMGCMALFTKIFNRNYLIFNVLLFSFAMQLLIDPILIFNLGFWLSYLAVMGILFIQPHLIIPVQNPIKKWLQDNISVGVSAQIATLPILLGFLGKFPLVFVITNLITLPLSIWATYAGFALLFLAEIPFLNEWAGYITEHLFSWVLMSNHYIAQISFSSIEFQPSLVGLIVSSLLLILIVYYLNKRKQLAENSVLRLI